MEVGDCDPTSLQPGFRFHPTDEELVSYYLKRKVCGKPFRIDAITEIDIYKAEPWDLPGLSKLKTRDLEWYFFSGLDKKYGNGSRTNRATGKGYWKTTGKDRTVHHRSRAVGMKKTLVYHQGRAPRGERTNWVMHEYKIVDEVLEKAGFPTDGVVLCRIFLKSGSGPKNGEQYGAPLIEEEWEDDNLVAVVPGDVSPKGGCSDGEAFIEHNDLDQNFVSQLQEHIPVNTLHEDESYAEDSKGISGNDQMSLPGESEFDYDFQVSDDQMLFALPMQVGSSPNMASNEPMDLPNNMTNESINCPSNELFSTVADNVPFDDGIFVDTFDFFEPAEENSQFFDVPEPYMDDDIAQYLSFYSSPELMGSDVDQIFSTKQNVDDTTWPLPSASQPLPSGHGDDITSSSKQVMDVLKSQPSEKDIHYPLLDCSSSLLENIPAPPAFASEFPAKDMVARLDAVQSSSRVQVAAGMIRVDMTVRERGLQWSLDKTGSVNFVLSFDLPQVVSPSGLESFSGMLSKMGAAVSRSWFCSTFSWVLVFAASLKIATFIYAK